ncbi:MAG TPA: hypothetical protein RMF84_05730 [Polyangiaceae bacterium LLY-WYZ-14_1]|nr:hypothetical protein [Polyangiaceae bacterium LLY-WYZ-14_1]
MVVVRRALAAMASDDVVILDLDTGEERDRVRVPTALQSYVFPAPGDVGDLYYLSLTALGRITRS